MRRAADDAAGLVISEKLRSQINGTKVAIRNVRRDGMDQIKKAKGMSEDDQKFWSEEVQDLTDKTIAMVDRALESKQHEIMQV